MPAWNEAQAAEIMHRHDGREGALLPILHDVQATFGHVPAEAIPFIAQVLNLTRAEVQGVVSFYHDFRERPAGRHVLKICRAESCQAMNSEALAEQVLKHFGLTWGETTPDGRLTIEPTYCLGLCACSPSALLDSEPMARLDATCIEEIAREVGR
ncbi:formate dehydrogenase gamma subunit [Enhydrobacter aerosaccus]|uniref:Formate dehydrogenase gamma subunit n=1 Tax=Enhydrobacter aerosaccus TaxID=225324 RepID=A0A1T4PPJ1_9HYPH|nr:formate dehydrogenase subunit gamma [Enhydrobacter aerosaccus]SJZ93166.1 formate dehydrogenase gamma subunit [Enhydrobacter aerosaccus]